MDEASAGSTTGDGHVDGIEDQLGAQVSGHRPADDSAAEHVHDDGQIEEALPGRQIGDVGHPQPVGADALNVRSTRSGADAMSRSRTVVRVVRRRWTPRCGACP